MIYSNKDEFLILRNIKNFIMGLEKMIINFSKKDMFSRDIIYNDSLEVMELICMANYTKDVDDKRNYQIRALSKINKIDFYIERAYKLKYISDKEAIKKSNELLVINKMIYKWCNNG